ncbi:LOW QUALITY PROTEIN: hypothetical protein Cgig2_008312 [Carnegiea gigantea]|uniref:Aminotransferase-like plant mobile domain-containing protein n=1 Tax=Carnegiea gigantea TaxID=171969 RepID=A0A9Q1Q652_9CARY|nr:LOW QUALITY PROTEIN: hypothetical protein Cgig2_008312 [Carnegiea gigantea]
MKRASKTATRKKVQFRHAECEEPVIANVELSTIRSGSWTRLLRHRMAPGGFLILVERLDYEQWSAIMGTGFEGILAMRTKLIPKRLASSLNLPNGKLLINEEDVYATLELPMGQLEIKLWRRRWNVERGGPPIGSMHEVILEHGGHGHEFITDFIAYVVSTCIVGNANGTCHFRVLKYLHNVNEIQKYNWCAYAIKCQNDAIIEWKKDKSKFFTRSLLLLMVSTFDQPISLMCSQVLFYLDTVLFRGNKVEIWFPVVINWHTEKVRNRDKMNNYRRIRKRIIKTIDYHNIACLAEADLEVYMQELLEGQTQQGGSGEISMTTATREKRCLYCPHCNGQRQDVIPITNDPFELGVHIDPRGSIAVASEQHIYQGNENVISAKKSQETTKDIHKAVNKQGNKKGKQVVQRQQPKRIDCEINTLSMSIIVS